MELQFSPLQFMFCSFLFLLVLLKLRKKSKDDKIGARLLPPGPRKLPLIGYIHRLFGFLPPHAGKINGYEIPAKARIMVNAWAISRDPEQWDDAESFIPERFLESSIDFKGNNFEYIPFGAGRRICPGIVFGNANVEIQLAMLLYHFDWSLPNGMKPQDLTMTERMGITVSRKDALMVILTLKMPLPIQ